MLRFTRVLRQRAIPLTVERYPSYVRDPRFAKVTAADVDAFRRILAGSGDAAVETNSDELQRYNVDWLRKYRGQATVALRPRTTEEVAAILAYCNQHRLAVVPQGGNTGLVGGGVPVFDEIVLSLSRMNCIESVDDVSGVLVCQAGCVLETLDKHVAKHGLIMPLDLGAKGSCHIGGNVATNAGGLRLLRYGSLHGSVLGLEIVTADGTVLNQLNTLRKDNTGYDLKQLMIGSEGTLGVITRVAILAPQRPKSVQVVLVSTDSFAKVLELFKTAKQMLGEVLSACEFFDQQCVELVEKHIGIMQPLEAYDKFYVLVEVAGSNEDHDMEKLSKWLDECYNADLVKMGTIAKTMTQYNEVWRLRESISEAISRHGTAYKYDLSVPVPHLYDIVPAMQERLESVGDNSVGVCGFGHLGDGNLHLNVYSKTFNRAVLDKIEPFVYEYTAKHRGSISAEHGLGLMKAPHLHHSKDAITIEWMRRIKQQWDPQGILNPYKYLPAP